MIIYSQVQGSTYLTSTSSDFRAVYTRYESTVGMLLASFELSWTGRMTWRSWVGESQTRGCSCKMKGCSLNIEVLRNRFSQRAVNLCNSLSLRVLEARSIENDLKDQLNWRSQGTGWEEELWSTWISHYHFESWDSLEGLSNLLLLISCVLVIIPCFPFS